MSVDPAVLVLIAATVVAGFVNGGLGYGFSSITLPLALLYLTNRALNPVLVLIELVANGYNLWLNRKSVPRVWPVVRTITLGLLPFVAVGSWLLTVLPADYAKLGTYLVLLPLIVMQLTGWRRSVNPAGASGFAVGAGVGTLYSLTTISGPPLAVLFNNEGLVKEDFRAALSIVRVVECAATTVAYLYLGLFSADTLRYFGSILPGVLIAAPIGAAVVGRISAERFRFWTMNFDLWIVSLGLTKTVLGLVHLPGTWAYAALLAAVPIGLAASRRRIAALHAPTPSPSGPRGNEGAGREDRAPLEPSP